MGWTGITKNGGTGDEVGGGQRGSRRLSERAKVRMGCRMYYGHVSGRQGLPLKGERRYTCSSFPYPFVIGLDWVILPRIVPVFNHRKPLGS